jgi:arabinofuranan 3-O-arabinosyltransferase
MRSDGNFGVASLYRAVEPNRVASVVSGLTGVYGSDTASLAETIAGRPLGGVAVTDPNQPVDAFRAAMLDPGTVPFTLATGGSFRLERGGAEATYRIGLAGNRLTLSDADTVSVDGRPLPNRPPLGLDLDPPQGGATPGVVGLDVDGRLQPLHPAGDVVVVGPHTTLTAYAAQPGDGLSGPFRPAEDCDGAPASRPDANPLRLAVTSGQQCSVAPVRSIAGAVYRLHFLFRDEGGAKARVCLWQDGPAGCASLPSPPAASGWAEYTAITRLDPHILSARLYLYADASAGEGVAEFRDVALTPLRAAGSAVLSSLPSASINLDLSKGRHTVSVDRYAPAPANELAEFSTCTLGGLPYPRYPTGNRQPVQPDGTVPIDAPRSSVCAEAAPVPVVPGAVYRFSADYRGDFGQTARICVREDPSERCADIPALTRVPQWQSVRAFVRPDFATTRMRPQVSAGQSVLVPTRAAFRNIALSRVSTVSVSVSPVDVPAPKRTTATSVAVSPSEHRLVVHGATGPFAVVLRDSYAPGWSLDGLPAGWSARHLVVDGYANGWLVEGTGDAVLTVRYGPQRWASAALMISLIAGAVAIAMALGGLAVRNGGWGSRLVWLRRKVSL